MKNEPDTFKHKKATKNAVCWELSMRIKYS